MKKFKFASVGDMTVVLRGTYQRPVLDSFGRTISNETVPPIKLVFDGGFTETDNEDAVTLLKRTVHWENDVYWYPGCEPKSEESTPETVKASEEKSKDIVKARGKKAQRRKQAQDNALEGSIPREQ